VYSLYLALKQIYLKKNEALIIANGDCIYEQQFIKEFLKSKRIDVIVSDRRIYKNDLMKIKLKNGCVEKISKNMDLKFADSTSTSMFKISHKTMLRLMKVLQKYVKENRLKCWFEDAMAQIFPSVRFGLFDIEGKKWIEVDCLKDLQEARTLFKKTDRRQRCES
jgi:choline kinase